MRSESFLGRRWERVRKKQRRRSNVLASSAEVGTAHRFESLEDRSLLSATYLPINPTGSANPSNMAALGGQVLFAANDGTTGVELWKSDGTVSGTALVKDIFPGTTIVGSISTPNSSDPTDLVAVGSYVYFAANDGTDGVQLWRSDGTSAGTVMITDLNVSGGGMNPADLTNVNGQLYFTANDGTDGNQVWTTDGTTAGTSMVTNLQPTSGTADPSQLTTSGTSLYFTATASTGVQLYVINAAGTVNQKIVTLTSSSGGVSPTNLTNVSGTLFFTGFDTDHGNQLWRSNGTALTTGMVTIIGSGTASSNPAFLTNVSGTLFFSANDGTHGVQLWKSDGTSAGTTMVADLNTASAGASANPADLIANGSELYFRATDGVHGTQLWKSDGTTAGTVMVALINASSAGATPDNLTAANGYVFFTANDGVHGFELWQSDGTSAGTTLLDDINPGAPSSNPADLTVSGSNLFAAANDGTHGVSLYAAPIPTPAPTLQNTTYAFTPGTPLTVSAPGVLTGSTVYQGGTLTAVLVSGPSHGALTLNGDGSFTYTPNAGFDGKDTFTINATDGTHTAVQAATVTVESLDFRWVGNLYTDVLGRAAGTTTDAEINSWVGQIAGGATRQQITNDFVSSAEYFSHLVNGYFEQFLQRAADPTALAFFVSEFEAGATSYTVQAQILTSSEFMTLSGSVNGFISNLYGDLLNRAPSDAEFGYWVAQMNNGLSAVSVVSQFLTSGEYFAIVINSLYEQFLNRPADAAAMAYWLGQFELGQTPQALTAALASSNEFYNI
ncbi:MAG TPA: ELWxxDGT repeat protein [Pirellulales bacterium]|jgi:ELWxxDGT repeat protein|nr:ELWxxDGT repeat protein [Pirellulales bacterium]